MTWRVYKNADIAIAVLPRSQSCETALFLQAASPHVVETSARLVAGLKREEFLRSRWLLQEAFGLTETPSKRVEGDLEWPPHLTGSITHKNGHVGSALGQRHRFKALGIDIEDLGVSTKIAEKIALPSEYEHLPAWLSMPQKVACIFSLKEALFKALFPLGRRRFWFDAVRISGCYVQCEQFEFRTELRIAVGLSPEVMRSLVLRAQRIEIDNQTYWLSLCALPASGSDGG